MLTFLRKLFRKKPEWEYGTCNKQVARRRIKKGNVQFIMWKAGEQGHTEDFWINFDPWWWDKFVLIPDNAWGFSHENDTP